VVGDPDAQHARSGRGQRRLLRGHALAGPGGDHVDDHPAGAEHAETAPSGAGQFGAQRDQVAQHGGKVEVQRERETRLQEALVTPAMPGSYRGSPLKQLPLQVGA
jgi:hypothetical protein